jgi:pimeloyl-ACP methyl ester carboxylesterase
MRIHLAENLWLGCDQAGSGVPLVLLHAFPLSRRMWERQRQELQSCCRILTPDLRGFGDSSPWDGPPSVERMADDILALVDRLLPAERIVLGGLSMGGYVALAFARKYPDRLRALILADTRAEADGPEARANREKTIALVRDHSAADVVEQMLPRLLAAATRDAKSEVVEEVRRLGAAQTREGVAAALQALRDRPDATSGLATIAVPTLVLVGAEDALTPPAVAQGLAAAIRGAQLAVIPEAGHLANLEQPERFNDLVATFVRRLG